MSAVPIFVVTKGIRNVMRMKTASERSRALPLSRQRVENASAMEKNVTRKRRVTPA